ncbi:MAG: CinA family protein, partial [Planctomycetota bacterium]
EPTVATIRQCLGTLVFGEGDDELQDAVLRLLRRKQETLATAEWGTAGLVADWLGNAGEAPGHFVGGVVVASESALERLLEVPGELIAQHTPTSAEVAQAMAAGCRRRFGADYGLAVSRFPRFDPTATAPEPMFVALAHEAGVEVKAFPFTGHPALLRVFSAKRALNLVRLTMLEGSEE